MMTPEPAPDAPKGRLSRARQAQALVALALAGGLVWLLGGGLDLGATHPGLAGLVIVLYALNALWLGGAAVTAVFGLRAPERTQGAQYSTVAQRVGTGQPGRCAVLWLVCGEDPEALASRAGDLLSGLKATGQAQDCEIFILSDTKGEAALAREKAALSRLGDGISYRNRTQPVGRKPGNLRDWIEARGAGFETMLILDADSGFSAHRLAALRAQMASEPHLGLIQPAIRLRPGTSRFAALQRLSGRLCGPVFARGLARLSADAGNFWGHNALVRVRAFQTACDLPVLSGPPPFGGPVLSHDFVEAALLVRAGWGVRIDPDSRGSHEDAPETIAAHMRRDRRWAQGNIQHLRIIAARGLHPASRMHLLSGIHSYLSAPIWLALVLLFGSGAVHATGAAVWALVATLALLVVPKVAGVAALWGGARTGRRRALLLRGFGAELALSTVFAPLGLVRRTGFVAAILGGSDSGWTPSGRAIARATGRAEALAGFAILAAVAVPQALLATGGWAAAGVAAAMVLPIVLPLFAAPLLIRWFDAPARSRDAVAAYYDASTRRFLSMGGSGDALAIHRPLWAPGITDPQSAAAHVNDLIAEAAEAALGHPPQQVRDMGCGVGGTLFHLAQRWPQAALAGLTLSTEQVRLAGGFADALGLQPRVQVLRSDFRVPTMLPRADLVLAVESHVHAASADEFLQAARGHLSPGGILVIVDDMPRLGQQGLDPKDQRLLDAFRRGWRLGHATPAEAVIDAATAQGFTLAAEHDLTPLLRLDRFRDRALRLAGPVADALGLGRWAIFANMIGGNALTQAYRRGLMSYRMVVLRADGAACEPLAKLADRSAA